MDESRTADAPTLNQSPSSRFPVRAISLAIVLVMVIYVGMATLADSDAFSTAVAALPGMLWVQVVLLSLLSYLLRFVRWHYFIIALGDSVPVLRNLEIYLAAFALTLTPGKAGETMRSVYLYPYRVSYPKSIGAFVAERLLDLVAVGALASLVISMFPEYRLWLLGSIVCSVTVLLLLFPRLLSLAVKRLTKGFLGSHAAKGMSTIGFLLTGRRLVVGLPLSFMAWAVQGTSLCLIIQALGHDLPTVTVIGIYCMSILAGAASLIPGGLGATEVAIVLLLSAAGVDQTDAITASFISRGLTLWLAVGIGVFTMTKTALANQSPRSPQSKEKDC